MRGIELSGNARLGLPILNNWETRRRKMIRSLYQAIGFFLFTLCPYSKINMRLVCKLVPSNWIFTQPLFRPYSAIVTFKRIPSTWITFILPFIHIQKLVTIIYFSSQLGFSPFHIYPATSICSIHTYRAIWIPSLLCLNLLRSEISVPNIT